VTTSDYIICRCMEGKDDLTKSQVERVWRLTQERRSPPLFLRLIMVSPWLNPLINNFCSSYLGKFELTSFGFKIDCSKECYVCIFDGELRIIRTRCFENKQFL